VTDLRYCSASDVASGEHLQYLPLYDQAGLDAAVAAERVKLHHTECAAQAAEEDRDELLALLSALVDRCAFDGVPNDSLSTWLAAHDAVMSRKRA
jgi:hypothetical protein